MDKPITYRAIHANLVVEYVCQSHKRFYLSLRNLFQLGEYFLGLFARVAQEVRYVVGQQDASQHGIEGVRRGLGSVSAYQPKDKLLRPRCFQRICLVVQHFNAKQPLRKVNRVFPSPVNHAVVSVICLKFPLRKLLLALLAQYQHPASPRFLPSFARLGHILSASLHQAGLSAAVSLPVPR